ncbi:hypothetical protein SAMN02745866_00196 [Alteromonadaceae bacterium Bs31]|nr:hypothetical protein SAMN02745866_00196 [Alteromonadaceae bacterium Bs31]
MHPQRVVVVPRSRFRVLSTYLMLVSASIFAEQAPIPAEAPIPIVPSETRFEPSANGYVARIELNSPEEIRRALLRAEEFHSRFPSQSAEAPLAMVLHGPEVAIFLKENYAEHKDIVDLAARLSAFELIDIKVCRTRMGVLGRAPTELVPFVGTVPFGPLEIDRLLKQEKFVYF